MKLRRKVTWNLMLFSVHALQAQLVFLSQGLPRAEITYPSVGPATGKVSSKVWKVTLFLVSLTEGIIRSQSAP